MGLIDFIKNKSKKSLQPIAAKPTPSIGRTGKVEAKKIEVDSKTLESLSKTFIAFDVETTGLSTTTDRIVEIGAVVFVNGTPTRTFGTLVNPHVNIAASATAVNHITNAMLSTAPHEKDVYLRFVEFLGDALQGNIIMCAHNARFDFDFLCNTLARLGYSYLKRKKSINASEKEAKFLR